MTATVATVPAAGSATVPTRLPRSAWLRDSGLVAWRNVMRIVRTPQLLVFSTIQPIMFVLLFRYVFGSAINIPGVDYVNYLMPGVFVQTVLFGGASTAIGLADDVQSGVVDRYRSLPISRTAVLAGRTLADTVRNAFVVALMVFVGVLVGFRFQQGFLEAVVAILVALAFGHAMSWFFAMVGLSVKDPETAQVASFLPVFPLAFASTIFVPTAGMPDWLRVFAENQPVSAVVNAVRGLTVSGGDVWHLTIVAFAWMIGIVLVFAPLAIRRYRRG